MRCLPRPENGGGRRARRKARWNEAWKRRQQTINSRVPVSGLEKIQGVVADVARFEYRTLHDFTLDAQRPLMCLLWSKVRRDARLVERPRVKHAAHQCRSQIRPVVGARGIC